MKMTYETLVAVIEKAKKVKLKDLIGVIEELYRETEIMNDSIDSYFKLYDLCELVLQQPLLEGSDSDFHNLTVTCARQDDYDMACRFLDKGLLQYPCSIDLLSDYLNYGMNCGRYEQSKKAYYLLLKQRNIWNWRAYHFSISYLMESMSIDLTDNTKDIQDMISDFQKKLPMHEESYMDEAEFLSRFSNCETSERTFLSVLEYATSDNCPVQRTPKCDLKLADYYYNSGKNLDKARALLDRCKRNSIEPQLSVNRNYVYLLSALCKMSQYYDLLAKETSPKVLPQECEKEKMVLDVYEDYHIAALKISDSRVQSCKGLIEAFIRETGITYPYEDDGIENMI